MVRNQLVEKPPKQGKTSASQLFVFNNLVPKRGHRPTELNKKAKQRGATRL